MANISDLDSINEGLKIVSSEVGILSHVASLSRMHNDPKLLAYGIWPCDTSTFHGNKFGGRSSGCGDNWKSAFLTTIGEVIERYCAIFYDEKDLKYASYNEISKQAIAPSEFALFHKKQYEGFDFPFAPFTNDLLVHWVECESLIDGKKKYCPGSLIHIPWNVEEEWICLTSSTGLAGHTNYYDAILNGLYEVIERDSFVITWMQKIRAPKIRIEGALAKHLEESFPGQYEFHFMDITYDLKVPTVFGFCFGESDYGKFVVVGTATRSTLGEAIKKVIKEMGQGVSYLRFQLEESSDWEPGDDFDEIMDFEQHSILYTKRPNLAKVFDIWRNTPEEVSIEFDKEDDSSTFSKVRTILKTLDDCKCDVLFKDLTTVDVHQLGYKSIRILVPQLIQMSGAYPFYFNGGSRLYEVPKKMGYTSHSYDNLNQYPHPFP